MKLHSFIPVLFLFDNFSFCCGTAYAIEALTTALKNLDG
jgi:hypothetical protein